jgi:hypothetical protein
MTEKAATQEQDPNYSQIGKKNTVHTNQAYYFADYRSMKLTRDTSGVLIVEIHSDAEPLIFTASRRTVLRTGCTAITFNTR